MSLLTSVSRGIRRVSLPAGLAVALSLVGPAISPVGPIQAAEADAPLQLPKVTVNGARLSDYPRIPLADLSGGGLAPTEPPVSLFFPGRAYSDGIPKGFATVCVELDDKGNAIDYLLVAYTEKYFGDALLRNARDTKYSPLLFKGVAIPSRFNFGYEFRPEFTVAMNNFGAMENRLLQVRGGRPDFKYQPVTEEALDTRLEYVRQAVPYFPDGYVSTGEKADWVVVSFYVDEQGQVRVPNVDSASSPLLVRNALKAVHYWQFKPPTVKGKPALVYAAFAVSFVKAPE
jgi:TonB family protein